MNREIGILDMAQKIQELTGLSFIEIDKINKNIENECLHLSEVLQEKNKKYGFAYYSKTKILSKGDRIDSLNYRIDEKIKRIQMALLNGEDNEDAEMDLIGTLISKRVLKNFIKK